MDRPIVTRAHAPRQVVIPYRDRAAHLRRLLPALASVLGPPATSGGGSWAEEGGAPSAGLHCCFVLPLIHPIPDSRRDSVRLFMKRQCDRTLVEPSLHRSWRAFVVELRGSHNVISHCHFLPYQVQEVQNRGRWIGLEVSTVRQVLRP